MKSHQHKIYLMKDYEQFRKDSSNSKLTKRIKYNDNVCLLKQFRQYDDRDMVIDKPEGTAKSVFLSVIVICLWFFAMGLLAKVTYPFLQAICINSVQELSLGRE
ncbi:hypothetical protein [Rivularia sp. UHCC 0363]|uniref:hypothetical protein n=1 Tax=Rivularia sp. UHCC 0363 TaxID=3110244 RepID=UPI002B1FACE3|nr:hypothetical protein [Rivularia sp. UHCC 0363]MEA5593321.1 hypothetical protein [Rivularia sp. UHCC 0363]